jgi:ketosteroid isomerase-like protein
MAENLDLLRSIFAAWERGDWSSAAWAGPEIEYVIADGPDPVSATGLEGMAAAWRRVMSGWEELRAEADEYRCLDDERVLVLFRRGGRGKRSGLELGEMQSKGAVLFDVHDGKVTTLVWYWDRDRALADLGLEE